MKLDARRLTITREPVQMGAPVRRLRTAQGLSMRTPAARANFSPRFISQVENGQVSPSIASLERIDTVLGVTLAGFFPAPQPDGGRVIRSADRQNWPVVSGAD
jgi:transcriptional regulator with XRE-family HTH domain